ncbi:MAG: hypothetical protein KDB92_13825, partial [Chitinophagaceae bacterium]|nr:hypothetical protein [Chitinophagaceae bacterium]
MRKLKQITILGVTGFLLVQVARAAGIEQTNKNETVVNDTTVTNDTLQKDQVTDSSKDFKNLYTAAVMGDG